MALGHFCNREVVITEADSSLISAARLMREFHVGDLVVVEPVEDGNRPVGIITDRDMVVKVVAQDLEIHSLTVGDVMSFDLVTGREDEDVWDTLQRMREHGVRRIPVVDHRGMLVGIITSDDLVSLVAEELSDVVRVVRHEEVKERELTQ
jgi:CBS domain-containing protein